MKLNNFLISIMLIAFLVMSVGSVFAANDADLDVVSLDDSTEDIEVAIDDSVVEADDEVSSDDNLLGEDGSSETVTNDTFFNYFDEDGLIRDDVTSNELVFEGEFSNLPNDISMTINKEGIKLTGKNAVLNNVSITVTGNNVVIDSFKINSINKNSNAIFISDAKNVKIINNVISFQGLSIVDPANAIYAAGADNLILQNNRVTVKGNKTGEKILYFVDCSGAVVNNNTLISDNLLSTGYQSGAVEFNDGTNDLIFSNNTVSIASIAAGLYPTTCGVVFAGKNVTLSGNDISVINDVYSYAICALGSDSKIVGNSIFTSSPNYACGVNLEGKNITVVDGNKIIVVSNAAAYGIYSGMTSGGLSAVYSNNNITVSGYFAVGASLSSFNETLIGNDIDLMGNYTIGVAGAPCMDYSTYPPTLVPIVNRLVKNNTINSAGFNVGTDDTGDWIFYELQSAGISDKAGNLTVEDNKIVTTGDYAVISTGQNVTVSDNYLAGKKGVGDKSVIGDGVDVSGSSPELKSILAAVDLYTTYLSGDIYYVTALDENGDPIKNATLFLTFDGGVINATTDQYGVATFFIYEWNVGNYLVTVSYDGNETYGPKKMDGYIQIDPRVSNIVAPNSVNVLLTAVKKGAYYTITLKDDRDNGLAGEKVAITFNGKTSTYTTDGLGVIKFKLSASKAGTQKLTVKFNSNDNYFESSLTATVKINKEATKLTAKKKTFKAKTKTKKYTVTLKDSKGKAIKKAKVTLKVKGKTYKAKTNAKGKATFKIKKLTKKGKYTAKVTFKTTALYKAAKKSVKITVKK